MGKYRVMIPSKFSGQTKSLSEYWMELLCFLTKQGELLSTKRLKT